MTTNATTFQPDWISPPGATNRESEQDGVCLSTTLPLRLMLRYMSFKILCKELVPLTNHGEATCQRPWCVADLLDG